MQCRWTLSRWVRVGRERASRNHNLKNDIFISGEAGLCHGGGFSAAGGGAANDSRKWCKPLKGGKEAGGNIREHEGSPVLAMWWRGTHRQRLPECPQQQTCNNDLADDQFW